MPVNPPLYPRVFFSRETNSMDRLGFTKSQDHVHKLPYNQPNAVSVYVAWKALDTFARRHGVKSFLVKGSVFETEVIKAWLGALDLQPYPVRRGLCPNSNPPPMNPIPDYGITATGETTAIVPAHRRKPEELQPFATAVARNMPRHDHRGDYSHCSAVECMYHATYYTPEGSNNGTILKACVMDAYAATEDLRYANTYPGYFL